MAVVEIKNENYGITFEITYSQTPNVATNKSVVSITKLRIKSTKYTGLYYFDGSITVGGTTVVSMSSYYGTHRASIDNTSNFFVVSGSLGSVTIAHKDDGSQTVTFALSISGIYNGSKKWTISGSQTVALTPIAPISALKVSNGTLGVEQEITVDRQVDTYSHTITYNCGSVSGTICEKSQDESFLFTPSIDLASQNTTGASVTMKFTLQTYSGDSVIGSSSVTVLMAIPDSVKPKCSVEYTDGSGYFEQFGGFVQGESYLDVTVTGEPVYGSAIDSYKSTVNGATYTTQTFTTGVLTESGTLSATVTDQRGRTSDAVEETINVLPYSPPKVTLLSVHRCDEDGTENSTGSFAKVTYSFEITSLSDQNGKTVVLKYKKPTDVNHTLVMLDSVYSAENSEYIFSAEVGFSYEVVLMLEDSFHSGANATTRSTSVSTADVIMHFRADAKGMGLGKISDRPNALDMGWDIELNDRDIFRNGVMISARESADYPGCFYKTIGGYDEWVNPPMVAGVQYRTTERFNGKPVYVKLINCGAGANNTEKKVSTGVSNAIVFDFGGYHYLNDSALPMPYYGYVGLYVTSKEIIMKTTADYSRYTAYVWFKYYKTTD